jgi:hypothetical protein
MSHNRMLEVARVTPDFRNNGALQFIQGYTGGGNPMCSHLTRAELARAFAKQYGEGMMEEVGNDFVWMQSEELALPKLEAVSLDSSSL